MPHASEAYPLQAARGWTLVVMLAVSALLISVGPQLLMDPDTQWHVAVGRLIWEEGRWPTVDSLSHTFAGHPWIAKEWLSQVIMFAVHRAGGWPLLVLATIAATAISVGLGSYSVMRSTQSVLVGLVAALVMFLTLQSTIIARPHMLALPVLALWTYGLVQAAQSADAHPPWWLLPVMAVWANLHAAFTLGFIILAALALDALVRARPENRLKTAFGWFAFGLLAVLSSMIHPYGWSSLLLTFKMAGANEAVALVDEWTPMAFGWRAAIILLTASILIAVLIVQDFPKNVARVLLAVFITWLAFRYERFVMVLAIVMPLIAADALGRAQRASADWLVMPRLTALWNPVAVGMGIAAVGLLVLTPIRVPEVRHPQAAFNSVPEALRKEPVLNSYNLGGFLIGQGIRTFIDGRSDQLFLGGFVTRHVTEVANGNLAYLDEITSRYGLRWAFVISDGQDDKLLAAATGWARVYKDDHAAVYVRKDANLLQSGHGGGTDRYMPCDSRDRERKPSCQSTAIPVLHSHSAL